MTKMTPKKRKQLQDVFVEALLNSAGNISHACKKVGISRNTYYEWRKEEKEFDKACEEQQEAIIDLVETKLMTNIQEGKTAEIIFFLKTKAKHRGYVEKQEVEIKKDMPDLSGLSTQEMLELLKEDEQ
jgi:transposase-like protein